MRTTRRSLLLAGAAASAPLLINTKLHAAKGAGELAVSVTGKVVKNGVTSVAAGTLTIERFVARAGQLLAVGTVALRLTDALGTVLETIVQAVEVLTTIRSATCEVLELVLGPLHLELLGLIIDLNQVVLTIKASPAGGLLGALLCALVNLTDLGAIANILNQILALFGSV